MANRDTRRLRHKMFVRQNGICFYCKRDTSFEKWTLDHVKPQSRGGPRNMGNVVGACMDCNNAKADMSLGEFLTSDYLKAINPIKRHVPLTAWLKRGKRPPKIPLHIQQRILGFY